MKRMAIVCKPYLCYYNGVLKPQYYDGKCLFEIGGEKKSFPFGFLGFFTDPSPCSGALCGVAPVLYNMMDGPFIQRRTYGNA